MYIYIKIMTKISGNKKYPTSPMIMVNYHYHDKDSVSTWQFPYRQLCRKATRSGHSPSPLSSAVWKVVKYKVSWSEVLIKIVKIFIGRGIEVFYSTCNKKLPLYIVKNTYDGTIDFSRLECLFLSIQNHNNLRDHWCGWNNYTNSETCQ